MDPTTHFAINRKVVHEVFDDEIVIINLDNGNYYTLTQTGADIWGLVETGA
jgi:predicted transcriptional regulator